ncbi:MAG: acyltransferase family protein [Acidimicrobiales bacterium]
MAAAGGTRRVEHFPALDGIRALAIAGVVAYHLSPSALPGGYLGVDIFFVLSGFLITRLILNERLDTGRVGLQRFWARRARRLLPGLFLVLAALAVTAMVLPNAVDPYELRGDGIAALFYVANWHFLATNQSYFGHLGLVSPLEHTWTLAIEEQFYVVWPLMLLGLVALFGHKAPGPGREVSPRRLLLPVGLLAAGSVVAMALVYDGGRGLQAAYFGTECRAFELLAGGLAAIWLRVGHARGPDAGPQDKAFLIATRRSPAPLLQLAGVASLTGVVVALVTLGPSAFVFEGGLALLAGGVVLLIVASLGPGPVRSVLGWGPLGFLGRISYEIYLWHWPVIVVADAELHYVGIGRVGFDVAVTLLLACVSYFLLDAPLRRADYGSLVRRMALPGSVALTGGLLLACVPLGTAPGSPETARQLGTAPVPASFSAAVFGVHLPAPTGRIDLGFRPSPTHRLKVMFIGDSVMYQLELAAGAGLVATGDATPAVDGAILGWSPRGRGDFGRLAREIARERPDVVVAMWTQDNAWIGHHGVAAYETEVLDPLLGLLFSPGDGVRGVVFAAQPPQPPLHSWMPDVHADVYDPLGMKLWEQAMADESRLRRGRVAFVPATQMLELDSRYATWLASPGGRVERVRQVDDFHLCLNGGVRYGAGVVQGLVRLFSLHEPRANWWLGSFSSARRWYRLPGFPAGMCPADAPAHLTGTSR